MTRRERLERRQERREEWANKAHAASSAASKGAREAVAGIPFGQPILVGHHSEGRHRAALKRSDSRMSRAVERDDMARKHEYKADGIQRQLDHSIFSDDDNAEEALLSRIAEREAEAQRIKAYNKTCRVAAKRGEKHGDLSLLDENQRTILTRLFQVCPYQLRSGGSFPAYELANLRGQITRDKKRLEAVKAQSQRTEAAEEATDGFVIQGEKWVSITFAEKPEREILTALKAAGFRWGGGCWSGEREKIPAELATT